MQPMMQCGCRAQGTNSKTGEPVCVVHIGLDAGATVVADEPDLSGRIAKCTCGRTNPSDQPLPGYIGLPFFEYHPQSDHDRFYCGHAGWE